MEGLTSKLADIIFLMLVSGLFCYIALTASFFYFYFQVDSAENDGQLESPKANPVACMTLEDEGGDGANISKTKKIQDDRQTNNSIKDGRSNSISGSISLQDSNIKEPAIPKSRGESLQSNASCQPKPLKKPAVRTKVPFEKGYSQMDWLKLTRTHPDLAGKL